MSLSLEDAGTLKAAGFLSYEIEKLAGAKTPDGKDQPPVNLGSPAWRATLGSRSDWTTDKIVRGWTLEEIESAIMNYYLKDPERSPFDFLKAEYKSKVRTDYHEGVQKRKQREIDAVLEKHSR